MNPKILVFTRNYLPGFRAGGPVRTISNLVEALGEQFDFEIVARDRDLGDSHPFSTVITDAWNTLGRARVFYTSPRRRSLIAIAKMVGENRPDAIYLNSFFDPVFTLRVLILHKLKCIPDTSIILAPRGEFSLGAMKIKSLKKLFVLKVFAVFGFLKGVVFQASSPHEVADIRNFLPFLSQHDIVVAPDLPSSKTGRQSQLSSSWQGPLRLCFLSRVSPMKNLEFALGVLHSLPISVELNIYGPIEDVNYWEACKGLIGALPENIKVKYCGAIPPERVDEALSSHDLLFLPTRGENYGHVIFESLLAGTPVLISDRTPWRNLSAARVGWDFSLDDAEAFADTLCKYASYGVREKQNMRSKAVEYANAIRLSPQLIEANYALLRRAVENAARE